ncbi:hypothetical protein Poli38472_003058 [Pythium oligandrum]|uniref:ODAD1 central coiled coil region domain-containing protein n=1 Tax=Pythium oligandrum TaxID=41045 RepID=A0A8K1FFT4_PYTOL|nr:hypothetical protein Poli38472_003058 [Pythium oligandrum]|eukprot:TMW57133.1 hypothetical protein Poli38472_003058 [Pythium oligandrum]
MATDWNQRNGNEHEGGKKLKRQASLLVRSVSESSLKKKQQGSLLDQELLVLERDEGGKRHARQLSNSLLEYAKKIEEMQAKNRRLEEELSFDDHITREDPFFNDMIAEKLSNMYLQGNNLMVRLELERKEVMRLNTLIQRSEAALAQQKTKLYELSALDHNHTILVGKIRKMEHDIDRRIVRMNEKLSENRKLRESIDSHRAERARMDAIYTKIATESLNKTNKVTKLTEEVEKLRQEVADIEREIEGIRLDGDEWERSCDQRAAVLLQELKEIALHQRDAEELVDADQYKFLGDNELMKHMAAAQENVLRSRVNRSRWKTGQAKITSDALLTKYQENRSYIEKIHEISGTSTVAEMIEAFNNQEVEHFEHIQHVNQLAEDIENHRQISASLREEIGKLKQRKDSVDFQRMNRIESLKSRIQSTIDQKKHKEESNHELQVFLAALKPSILMFHSRIGCPEIPSTNACRYFAWVAFDLLLSVDDGDMKKLLGDVEDQVVSILQKYSGKLESTRDKEIAETAILGKLNDSTQKEAESDNQTSSPGKLVSSTRRSSASPSGKARGPQRSPQRVVSNTQPATSSGEGATSSTNGALPPPLSLMPAPDVNPNATSDAKGGGMNGRGISALLNKDQPYRYGGLRPPHLSVEELKKKDNVEEEYPLTYDELKVKVWRTESGVLPQ